jgi:acyl carrier protein
METGKTQNVSRKDILERLGAMLGPWVSQPEAMDGLTEQTNLISDLGLDSIGILQVVLGAEKQFGISIDERELDAETFSRMGNLVNIIEKKIYEAD